MTINLTIGERFGRWIVIEKTNKRSTGSIVWKCKCDCGVIRGIDGHSLRRGLSKSCGCLQKEKARDMCKNRVTHGRANKGDLTYTSWQSMRNRCSNPENPDYKSYGGRDIKVCERWNSFENFLADMGERPEGTTIDRIDNNGHYEPSNCRWSTPKEQNRNKKNITLDKDMVIKIRTLLKTKKYTQKEIAKMFGTTQNNISLIKRNKRWI